MKRTGGGGEDPPTAVNSSGEQIINSSMVARLRLAASLSNYSSFDWGSSDRDTSREGSIEPGGAVGAQCQHSNVERPNRY